MTKYCPEFKITRLEGTYLEWVDVSALGLSQQESYKQFIDKGVVPVTGLDFGDPDGLGYVRINLATTRGKIEEIMKRICAK